MWKGENKTRECSSDSPAWAISSIFSQRALFYVYLHILYLYRQLFTEDYIWRDIPLRMKIAERCATTSAAPGARVYRRAFPSFFLNTTVHSRECVRRDNEAGRNGVWSIRAGANLETDGYLCKLSPVPRSFSEHVATGPSAPDGILEGAISRRGRVICNVTFAIGQLIRSSRRPSDTGQYDVRTRCLAGFEGTWRPRALVDNHARQTPCDSLSPSRARGFEIYPVPSPDIPLT